MCDPISIGVTTALVAGGFAAYGAYQSSKSQASMYQYQGNLAAQKAKLVRETADQEIKLIQQTAEQNIGIVQEEAKAETVELGKEAKKTVGSQKAALAAHGVGGVTAEDILMSTYDQAKLDELTIRYNADVQSWALRTQAKQDIWRTEEQAKQDIWSLETEQGGYSAASQQARAAGKYGVASTLLDTAASTAFTFNKYKKR